MRGVGTAKSGVYVTVDTYGKVPVASRPLCQGCTPPNAGRSASVVVPVRAEYRLVGASGDIALCRDCAIHSVKSIAARFTLFDPAATRDLMDFFAAEAGKRIKRPASGRRRPTKKVSVSVIDVALPLLLGRGKR